MSFALPRFSSEHRGASPCKFLGQLRPPYMLIRGDTIGLSTYGNLIICPLPVVRREKRLWTAEKSMLPVGD